MVTDDKLRKLRNHQLNDNNQILNTPFLSFILKAIIIHDFTTPMKQIITNN